MTTKIRSDRTSTIEGEFKLNGEMSGHDFGGVSSAISAKATGEFSFGQELDLKMLEGQLAGEVTIESPKVPLPVPLSFIPRRRLSPWASMPS